VKYLTVLLLLISSEVFSEIDTVCLSDCINRDYPYSYCVNNCEYGDKIPENNINYICVGSCLNNGKDLKYCKPACSY
jgi:hypothetical protein